MLGVACIAAVLASFVLALTVTHFARLLRLIDVPNERSSHRIPTAKGGGLGVVVGVAIGGLALTLSGSLQDRKVLAFLAILVFLAGLGLADDVLELPAIFRLIGHVLAAVIAVVVFGPVDRLPLPTPLNIYVGPAAAPMSVLWLVGVTNFFNFMDGLDGLAGGQVIGSCAGVLVAGWSQSATDLALLLIAATAAFLLFNVPPARLFLGDTGSTPLGFAIAALPLLASPPSRSAATFSIAVGLGLFLLDPMETLVRLYRRGYPLGSAHRLHSYQLLAVSERSRRGIAAILVAAGLLLSLLGGVSYRLSWLMWPTLGVVLVGYFLERRLAAQAEAARSERRLGPRGSFL